MSDALQNFQLNIFGPLLADMKGYISLVHSAMTVTVTILAVCYLTLMMFKVIMGKADIKDTIGEVAVLSIIIALGTSYAYLSQLTDLVFQLPDLYNQTIGGGSDIISAMVFKLAPIDSAVNEIGEEAGFFMPFAIVASYYIGILMAVIPTLLLYAGGNIVLHVIMIIFPLIVPLLILKTTRDYASRVVSAIAQATILCFVSNIVFSVFDKGVRYISEAPTGGGGGFLNFGGALTWDMMVTPLFYGFLCLILASFANSIASSLAGGVSLGVSSSARSFAATSGLATAAGATWAAAKGIGKSPANAYKAQQTFEAMNRAQTYNPVHASQARDAAKKLQARKNYNQSFKD